MRAIRREICLGLLLAGFGLFLAPTVLHAQGVITTVAGGGPNNVPATTAQIGAPSGLTVDSAGNLYLLDTLFDRVYKVTPSGQLTVVAGLGIIPFNDTIGDGGPATSANLQSASAGLGPVQGTAIDPNGSVFIADDGNYRVRRVDAATGIITTVAGNGSHGKANCSYNGGMLTCVLPGDNGPADAASLLNPGYVALDSNGNLFILDGGSFVRRVDAITHVITPYAGYGNGCASETDPVGDGCPATQASLSATSLAADSSGNLYIADAGDQRIRRVDVNTGVITTYAGSGVAGYTGDGSNAAFATLNNPYSIVMDSSNNLFILDSGNNAIRKVENNQIISTEVTLTANSFSPYGLAVDASDNLFFNSYSVIPNQNAFQVSRVDAITGQIAVFAGNGLGNKYSGSYSGEGVPAADAKLEEMNGVAFDGAGNIAIADTSTYRIRVVDAATGIISTVAGNGSNCGGAIPDGSPATSVSLCSPTGVAFNQSGDIVFSTNQNVYRVSGGLIYTYATGFNTAGLIAFDSFGNLYVADFGKVLWKIDTSGNKTVFAGNGPGCAGETDTVGDGCVATSAQLSEPFGVAVDAANNVYIADQGSNRVRRVDAASQIITTVAGTGACGYSGDGGSATSAKICGPDGVAVDNSGNLLISDTGNSVIRRVDASSQTITTVVDGSGIIDFTGDGGPPLCATLNFPTGLAIDAKGNLLIADDYNNRIRLVPLSALTAQTACVTVASSTNSSISGQNVTFTATISKSLSSTPSGTVTFNDVGTAIGTGNVSGGLATFTTSSLSAGSHTITAEYSGDGTFNEDTSAPFTQVVLSNSASTAPVVTSGSSSVFQVGVAASFTVTTTGTPVASITESGALPGGVTFADNGNGTGTLAGTPAPGTGGIYPLSFTAQNGVSPNATQAFTLTVEQAPAITSANSATFVIGTAASLTINATGFPTPTVTEAGTLPAGIAFNSSSGLLSGTPSPGSAGTYSISFTAQNSLSSVTQAFTLTVNPAPPTHFAISAPASANSGSAISINVSALDGSNNVVISYTGTVHFTSTDPLAALPTDYTFTSADSGTHTFSAALTTLGNQTITVTDTSLAALCHDSASEGIALNGSETTSSGCLGTLSHSMTNQQQSQPFRYQSFGCRAQGKITDLSKEAMANPTRLPPSDGEDGILDWRDLGEQLRKRTDVARVSGILIP